MRSIKTTVSLPPEHDRILKELAAATFDGNVSAATRRLLETHPVTKSAFALSTEETPDTR
jgi:hypothetical protein